MNSVENWPVSPVILPVPKEIQSLIGRELVRNLSRHARRAVKISADIGGIRLDRFPKSEAGAPMPVNGWYWSLAHKRRFVAGVVSPGPVGIDVEEIRPIPDGLYKRVAADMEWELGHCDRNLLFFRYWTAKESLTKSTGIGFRDFSKCRILEVPDDSTIVVDYCGRRHILEHYYIQNHIATIAADGRTVNWRVSAVQPPTSHSPDVP